MTVAGQVGKVSGVLHEADRNAAALTPRETEVLGLLALGFMNFEIADELVISVRTVEAHRSNIVRKTRCRTRAQLIAYALDLGIARR